MLSIDLWSNKQLHRRFSSLVISFQVKSYTILGLLADDRKIIRSLSLKHRHPQFDKIVSNFEITNIRFSALLDECSSLIQVMSFD